MSFIRLRTFTKFLSSLIVLGASMQYAQVQEAKKVPLGMLSVQTVAVAADGSSRMIGGIVVRVINKKTRTENFLMTNDAGIQVVPLRPGTYCYDALTEDGSQLILVRPDEERCFSIRNKKLTEVGVEFRK